MSVGVDRIRIRGEVMGGKEVMNREILCLEKQLESLLIQWEKVDNICFLILILSCKGYEVSAVYFKKKGNVPKPKAARLSSHKNSHMQQPFNYYYIKWNHTHLIFIPLLYYQIFTLIINRIYLYNSNLSIQTP